MKLFSKTFYNPWKPHICVDGFGKYFVRVRVGFTYFYWGSNHFEQSKYFAECYPTIEYARDALLKAKIFIEEIKEGTWKHKGG